MSSVDNLIKSLFKNITVRIDFKIKDGVLIKYNGNDETVEIPKSIRKIGDRAFKDCLFLKKIIIPAGVKIIGFNAFENCFLLKK